jgi:uncharacterized protein (DUF2235 family)
MTTIDPRLEPLVSTAGSASGEIDTTPPKQDGNELRNGQAVNQEPATVREQPKRIVVCADGTWNTPKQSSGGHPAPTNVWLMYQLVKPTARDGLPQLALYHTGVGTGGALDRIWGGANGVGLRRNILDCYRFVVENYHPGDHLYLFGFSRGAYTVRSLAGLIRNSGVIDRDRFPDVAERESKIREAWDLYRKRGDEAAPTAQKAVDFRDQSSHADFRIAGIGVWDTVGALGIPVSGIAGWISSHLFGFHDVTLSSRVDVALHALAIDEERGPFVPTLWQQQPDAPAQGQRMEQVWFTGVHSDVGGGYPWPERELANITLRWMCNRITQHAKLDLDTRLLGDLGESAIAIHDSLSWYYRLRPLTSPLSRVLDAGLGSTGARGTSRATTEVAHPSVEYCTMTYAETPMEVVKRFYAPANLIDYRKRMQAAQGRPPAAAAFPSDLRDASPGESPGDARPHPTDRGE